MCVDECRTGGSARHAVRTLIAAAMVRALRFRASSRVPGLGPRLTVRLAVRLRDEDPGGFRSSV
jgi:hypothetical protein